MIARSSSVQSGFFVGVILKSVRGKRRDGEERKGKEEWQSRRESGQSSAICAFPFNLAVSYQAPHQVTFHRVICVALYSAGLWSPRLSTFGWCHGCNQRSKGVGTTRSSWDKAPVSKMAVDRTFRFSNLLASSPVSAPSSALIYSSISRIKPRTKRTQWHHGRTMNETESWVIQQILVKAICSPYRFK